MLSRFKLIDAVRVAVCLQVAAAKAKEKEVTRESAGGAGRMTMAALKTGVSMRFTTLKGDYTAHIGTLTSPTAHTNNTMSLIPTSRARKFEARDGILPGVAGEDGLRAADEQRQR